MSDEELFEIMEVTIKLAPEDLPGRPMRRVQCDSCGEHVQDMRKFIRTARSCASRVLRVATTNPLTPPSPQGEDEGEGRFF
jgi:hypothetical protein